MMVYSFHSQSFVTLLPNDSMTSDVIFLKTVRALSWLKVSKLVYLNEYFWRQGEGKSAGHFREGQIERMLRM